jgi:hypothetical protein
LKKREAATRCSSLQEDSDTIKNTTKWQEMFKHLTEHGKLTTYEMMVLV